MGDLKGKSALVVGASSGVGRATLAAFAAEGARVCGVARNKERLEQVVRETSGDVSALAGDATIPEVAARLVGEGDPDIMAICLGAHSFLGPIDQHTWETFSAIWNSDVKATFHLCQAALSRPLKPGSVVVILSSGAAIGGSPLSGGYAGAKRMQWLLASYLQRVSDKRSSGFASWRSSRSSSSWGPKRRKLRRRLTRPRPASPKKSSWNALGPSSSPRASPTPSRRLRAARSAPMAALMP